jgi:putative hydrolase of the HAD superfamily
MNVFDVGNVLVRGSQIEIMRAALIGESDEQDIVAWAASFSGHHLWLRLNRGHFTEAEAQILFARELRMSPSQVSDVFHYVKDTQIAVPGTYKIFRTLHRAPYAAAALRAWREHGAGPDTERPY